MSKINFSPARGLEENVLSHNYTEGMIYFATDSGRIYLDADGENKIPLGGGGVSIIYGDDSNVIENVVEQTYTFHADTLQEGVSPKVDDLIINSDGKFYKIQELLLDDGLLTCTLIAVSGTGGGGGGGGGGGDSTKAIEITRIEGLPQRLIYGRPYNVKFQATSKTDDVVIYTFQIVNETTNEEKRLQASAQSGSVFTYEIGSHLFKGANTVVVWAEDRGDNMSDKLRQSNRNAIELDLKPSTQFNPLKVNTGALEFLCMPIGAGISKDLIVQVDPEKNGPTFTKKGITTSNQDVSVSIPPQSHGVHTIRAILSYGEEGDVLQVETDPLEYQVAWVEASNETPIIWLDSYPSEITDHDKLVIQYKVYNPANPAKAETRLYVNQEEIPTSPVIATYIDGEWEWEKWQITNYKKGTNVFTISSGKATPVNIQIKVLEDTLRNLNIIPDSLYLNLDSKGRSNKENQSIRNKWEYTNLSNETTSVVFNNFNWYNNGWILDENDDSCLRISNGSSIQVPMNLLPDTTLGTGLTFEFQFKLRNVQNYATLITTTSTEDEAGNVKVEKTASTEEGVFANYFNNSIGFCLGTQEAFFKTKNNVIVNGRYKENEIVNVSFVLETRGTSGREPLLYIYINGIMSGIASYGTNDAFNANIRYFEFNSTYCDVDLYKMRVYKKALSSSDVIHNYIADYADAELYDMNQLLDNNSSLPKIDFEKMLAYNKNHPDNTIMPYAVLELVDKTDTMERLPYVKGGKKRVNVEFVNPALDRAFEKGEIDGTQYITGCPSFHAENAEFDVQGTSSQGYPRRNYKGKFKSKDDAPVVWTYTNGPLKGQSLQSKISYEGKDYKYFYMDNKDAAESTFTWKADFMESSGTHNTGFTSFVKTLYSQHPLKDYNKDYVTGDHRTTIYGFPMLVFQKKIDGSYEFIGKYNFNLDKDCPNVIDFKNGDAQPYIANNPNVPVEYRTYEDEDGSIKPATYEMIAECWEFCNNQGTRCSFKQKDFDLTNTKGFLAVTDDLEYRYSYYKDDIDDALDLKGAFPSTADANTYLRDKYRNLERLFDWVMSTDTTTATNADLPAPVTYSGTTYTKDSSDYRFAKFTYEFDKHFNEEYCIVYFIMTELILGYDSRGKNMMLASWGPQTPTGDYIWYPIFYDVDTQLGVNNSGVPTWDYDTNATRDGQFSTANSVLWNNLWSCFAERIKKKYIELRKELLTIEKLNGFYDFNPAISKSYAMMGGRPLIAYNVDEYYKYISPAYEGYITTTGDSAKTATFFYCLQGTRELQRELFLRNRFNFLDSEWLAGSYSTEAVKMSIQTRINANDAIFTSDKFITEVPDYMDPNYVIPEGQEEIIAELRAKYNSFVANGGQTNVEYKSNPLDADDGIDIKPYLKQYVSLQFDTIPTEVKEYTGEEDSVRLDFLPNVQDAIHKTPMMSQQLVYIGGGEYISSLGDMSTRYLNELKIERAIRLKDIILGNENPAYRNELLTDENLVLDAGAKDKEGNVNAQAKTLLETLVLTNMGALQASRDVSGSEKLKTCRALGTNIAGMTFAQGVQLETLYLPKTIKYFNLTEPVELNGLLTTKPQANAEGEFPKGLYIEGLTDITIADDSKILLETMNLIGGKKLHYDTYRLVDTAVQIKKKMQANAELDNNKEYSRELRLNLENIHWSPYRKVEHGESIVTGSTYYQLQDNYTFTSYTPGMYWDRDTLNGKIYEYDAALFNANQNTITDLSLVDEFIISMNSQENYFKGLSATGGLNSLPYMSGDIFINNSQDNPISEYDLKNTYKDIYYPDLNIFVKYVDPAYTAKFIQIQDNGQEVEWDIHKYSKDTTHPSISTKENPEKLHYDFLGWSDKPNGKASDVLTEEQFRNFTFDNSHLVYTFYAVFEIHKYKVEFINPDNRSDDKTIYVSSGEYLHEPEGYLPYKPSNALADDKVFKFIGYSDEADGSNIVDITEFLAVKDYVFYAVHEEASVYDNVLDSKYFSFTNYTYSIMGEDNNYRLEGYMLEPAPGVMLRDKITIPKEYNDKPVVAISNFYDQEITHMYFEQGHELREIASPAFYNNANGQTCSTLKYFEFIDSIRKIGKWAFRDVLLEMSTCFLPKHLYHLGAYAFTNAFKSSEPFNLYIGSELEIMDTRAIANIESIPSSGNVMFIGAEGEPSQLNFEKSVEPDDSRFIYTPYNTFTINFYSNNYTSGDSVVYNPVTGLSKTLWYCMANLEGPNRENELYVITP